jgi:hypothetical protein
VRRLLALLAAVLMVALAVIVRDRIDADDETAPDRRASRNVVLLCVSELEPVCRQLAEADPALDIRVEPAGVTIERLRDGALGAEDVDIDAWLTLGPLATMIDEQRERDGRQQLFDESQGPYARSPLAIAIWNDRRQALEGHCGEAITWRCIGEVAGVPWPEAGGEPGWGAVKPSHPDPAGTATGLFTLAAATNSWFGNESYASQDFNQPEFRRWFERLERAIPEFPIPPRTPLDTMLFGGPAAFDLAGTTEAAGGPTIARSRDRDRLTIIYPSPSVVAEVVLTELTGSDGGGRVREQLESERTATALADAGWRVENRPVTEGLDPGFEFPASSGLPRPGVLEALRALWLEVT